MARVWLACAALLGLGFVALMALSAHGPDLFATIAGLSPSSGTTSNAALATMASSGGGPLRLSPFEQALALHGVHALALGIAALWIDRRGGVFANLAALGFLVGTLLFSGTIYARMIGEAVDPSLIPLGGSILLGAWAILALAALFGGAPAPARPVARPAVAPAVGRPTASVPAMTQPAAARPADRHQPPSAALRPPVVGAAKRPSVRR